MKEVRGSSILSRIGVSVRVTVSVKPVAIASLRHSGHESLSL